MLRGHMKLCPFAVNIILIKGHIIPYFVRSVWYLVRNMWLPSRCLSHSPSGPYLGSVKGKIFQTFGLSTVCPRVSKASTPAQKIFWPA